MSVPAHARNDSEEPLQPQAHTAAPARWLSFAFAFVGGYGDAAGFVLAKTFTGHITGSMVLAAISLSARDWRTLLPHLTAIGCFLSGVLFSVSFARLVAWPPWSLLRAIIGIEVALVIAGHFAWASHASSRIEIFVACLSLALGLQNGAFRRVGGISVHTTYLTGLITGLIAFEAEAHTPQTTTHAALPPAGKRSLLYGIWITFFLGADFGAAMAFRFPQFSLLGIAVILLALIAAQAVPDPRAPRATPHTS